jgi:hypothetical protein
LAVKRPAARACSFEERTDADAGPPLHVHEREDEAFYILEGQFEFQVGEQTLTVGPGDVVVAARGVPHTFRNLGSSPARKLALAWPAGLDQFFLEVGQPVGAATPASTPGDYAMARLLETVAKYRMVILAPLA